ncbi:MAG: Stp1/IreP family PP2C-type Ser/Thr phosphatase [Oscillospiraceae bacterium]|jgi:protein phosphatase|nr:Stp1/IreP family PP2C-type Ser/Thr phosphatase [Oscillospiraceae bacterium]
MFTLYGKTDIGKKRPVNQDAFAFGEQADKLWVVVCDGLGGEKAGEVASEIAVAAVKDFMVTNLAAHNNQSALKDMTIAAVQAANAAILQAIAENEELAGMSTTIVCAILFDGMLHVSNIGDSRAFWFSVNGVKQLTRDHSIVQVLIDSGKLSKQEARRHPSRNCLVRVLGLEPEVEPSYVCQEVADGEKILICTDGLYWGIKKKEMAAILEAFDVHGSVNELVDMALARGGSDNITAVLIG